MCILIRLKRNHSRGHVACSPSARGDLWCGLSGARRTRKIPGRVYRLGHSGHVSTRATSGETLPAGVLGTRVALAGFRVKYHSLDFAVHSGASGRVAAHSEASGEACGALGGFRGWLSASALGDRCRAPKGSEGVSKGLSAGFGMAPKGFFGRLVPEGCSKEGA